METKINVVLALMIVVSFLIAIVLHEFAHAQMAIWLGDPTPRVEGRYTLRLRRHLDPLGTLLCLILAFMPITFGPVGLGWGQPVKTDPWKLRGGRTSGPLLVALAGPLANLLLGLIFALLARLIYPLLSENAVLLRIPQFLMVFSCTNLALTILNILPLYPLDGYQIVYILLPTRQALQFARSGPWGPLIILALFFIVPFIAEIAQMPGFPLAHIPDYIRTGAFFLAGLVTNLSITNVSAIYSF
ncbi:site-2 protease family protein [Thermogemmatispora onikobensis]|uniref:site-2 protease family protein n=1 Tax=Thermogemmatispora onikobensis TaxID=732234 RepID=UPI000852FF0E|nr:site-2 protease family protein [Thermogemmatispora onikobensis]